MALAGGCLVAGFLAGMVVFGAPWHLRPAWGDTPTWLLVLLAAIGGWVGLYQLRLLREQVAGAADEAEARASAERRKLAEDVELQRAPGSAGTVAYVRNDSRRPIMRLSCNVMSRNSRRVVAEPDSSGTAVEPPETPAPFSRRQLLVPEWRQAKTLEVLRPRAIYAFRFSHLPRDADHVLVAWFIDDAGNRWQLDEYMHLIQTKPSSAGRYYLPTWLLDGV